MTQNAPAANDALQFTEKLYTKQVLEVTRRLIQFHWNYLQLLHQEGEDPQDKIYLTNVGNSILSLEESVLDMYQDLELREEILEADSALALASKQAKEMTEDLTNLENKVENILDQIRRDLNGN